MGFHEQDYTLLLEDLARVSARKGLLRYTRYLDPAQAVAAKRIANENKCAFACWGGYSEAERVIGCFYPFDETQPELHEYPLTCLHAKLKLKFGTISHRDILGAFMSLGLTRACLGDIIISGDDVYLFVLSQNAGFIASSLTSAGKIVLSFEELEFIPEMPSPSGKAFNSVVSSLRLDAVLAAAYRLSRSEAADYIHSGLVKVDHISCERVDFILKEGSLLSVKGKGRCKLLAVNGLTRKQRIGISVFQYE